MDRCIVRESVEQLRCEVVSALRSHVVTDEQRSALEHLIIKCDDALRMANKRGRLETPYAQPPFEFLEEHPEISSLIERV